MKLRNKLITGLLVFLTWSANAQNPLFLTTGQGFFHKPACSCVHQNGNISVGFFNATQDSINFKTWNSAGGTWYSEISIPSDPVLPQSQPKCIYFNDSLIVATQNTSTGSNSVGIYAINNSVFTELGRISGFRDKQVITDLKVYKNSLLILGNYDSCGFQGAQIKTNGASRFNGNVWQDMNYVLDPAIHKWSPFPAAILEDTLIGVINGTELVMSVLSPAPQWYKLAFTTPAGNPVTGIAGYHSKWLISRASSDTLIHFENEQFSYEKVQNLPSSPFQWVTTASGLFAAESGYNGRLLLYDPANNIFNELYRIVGKDSYQSSVQTHPSQNRCYLVSEAGIYYHNREFGKVAEIDFSGAQPVSFDTVSLFVFDDADQNYRPGAGETITNTATLYNHTYLRELKCVNGFYRDLVPDYNDADYELTNLEGPDCFQLSYSGRLKSRQFSGSIRHDSLYFPVHKNSAQNLSIKSYAYYSARLMDTVVISVDVFSSDCKATGAKTGVWIELEPQTLLVASDPPYLTATKNRFTFQLDNISKEQIGKIRLKVVYPISGFKIGQQVKHLAGLYNLIPEDTSDNKDSVVQKMVYSYDPNIKSCVPNGNIKTGLKTIRYYIDFQNEGNDVARRVTVVDTLEAKIPVYEFQMISSSHPYTVSLKNNVLTWVFDNINLPPKSLDPIRSQGHIIFEGRLKNDLAVGDSVKNKAYIYFDLNEPVETNTAVLIRGKDDPDEFHGEVDGRKSLKVFPNPAAYQLNIENIADMYQSVQIFNNIGQEVVQFDLAPLENVSTLIANWPQGIYFVRSSLGSHHKLLVK